MVCMDHSDASGSSTFFLFLYLFFLMKDYGSIVIFPTFIVYFVSLVLSASPFSSKLVFSGDVKNAWALSPLVFPSNFIRKFSAQVIVQICLLTDTHRAS